MYDFVNKFIWSDAMWVEGNGAWFAGAELNALFHLDFSAGDYRLVQRFPNSSLNAYRYICPCIRSGESLYCFPDKGSAIENYYIPGNSFTELVVRNPDKVRINIQYAFENDKRIFAVSNGLKQIIELDTDDNRIKTYHVISADAKEILGNESIQIDNFIYCISGIRNRVYEFDVTSKNVNTYEIPGVQEGFNTICCDGANFILTGFSKNIYIWNKERNETRIINELPTDFCICDFENKANDLMRAPFRQSVCVNGLTWLLPGEANLILYIDREYRIKTFEIFAEIETEKSLKRNWSEKYRFGYVLDGKKIGVYSYKNECFLEIDTEEMEFRYKDYQLEQGSKARLFNEKDGIIVSEGEKTDITKYLNLKNQFRNHGLNKNSMVGQTIYEALK